MGVGLGVVSALPNSHDLKYTYSVLKIPYSARRKYYFVS